MIKKLIKSFHVFAHITALAMLMLFCNSLPITIVSGILAFHVFYINYKG